MNARDVLSGVGVSAGVASGPVVKVLPAPGIDPDEPACTDPEGDAARVRAVLGEVADELRARADEAGDDAGAILRATARLAEDKALLAAATQRPRAGAGVTGAVHGAAAHYAEKLARAGGYLAERVTDLHDVRDRAICRLRGLPAPGVPRLERPAIVVAEDLAAAELSRLDPALVAGVVTAAGGPTSHSAVLAAQRGIPTVVQARGVLELADGTAALVDGAAGQVIVSPTAADMTSLRARAVRRAELTSARGRGETADGHEVPLLVNISSVAEARQAVDAEGVGLLRTEFLFLGAPVTPTAAEQSAVYANVLAAFGSKPVVIRTLDAGADTPLGFIDADPEPNPALGVRGLRLSMARRDLLDTQLKALAAAFDATGRRADLQVMAPMVTTVEEARWFAARVRAHGLPKVGVMVEVPAAAVRAERLLAEVDFASVGTNDLAQYTMAADRLGGEVSALLNPWQPALLDLVASSCRADTPVGACGEVSGDPLFALVLVGLGAASLSMPVGRVPLVRAALRLHDLAACRRIAASARAADTAEQARAAAVAAADPRLRELL